MRKKAEEMGKEGEKPVKDQDNEIVSKIIDLLMRRDPSKDQEILAHYTNLTDKFFTKTQKKNDNNLLHYAARFSNVELVRTIVQYELVLQPKDVKKLSARANEQGATPLYVALGQEKANDQVLDALFQVSNNNLIDLIKFYHNHEKRHETFENVPLLKTGRNLLGIMLLRMLVTNERATPDKKIYLPDPKDYEYDAIVLGADNLKIFEKAYEQYQNKAVEKLTMHIFDYSKAGYKILDPKLAANRVAKYVRERLMSQIGKNTFKQDEFRNQISSQQTIIECIATLEKNGTFAKVMFATDQIGLTSEAIYDFIIAKFYKDPLVPEFKPEPKKEENPPEVIKTTSPPVKDGKKVIAKGKTKKKAKKPKNIIEKITFTLQSALAKIKMPKISTKKQSPAKEKH